MGGTVVALIAPVIGNVFIGYGLNSRVTSRFQSHIVERDRVQY